MKLSGKCTNNLKNRLIEVVKGQAQLRWAEGDVTGNQVINHGSVIKPGDFDHRLRETPDRL